MNKIFLFFLLTIIPINAQYNNWELINGEDNYDAVIDDKSNIYLSRYPNIYKSSDLGETWNLIYTTQFSPPDGFLIFIDTSYVPDNRLIVNQGNYQSSTVFISYDRGETWNQLNTPSGPKTFAFTSFGNILVKADSGIYRSTNEGFTWTAIPNIPGYTKLFVDIYDNIYTSRKYEISEPGIYTWHYEVIYKSTDNGNTWDWLKSTAGGDFGDFAVSACTSGDIILGDYDIDWSYRFKPYSASSITYQVLIKSAIVFDDNRLLITRPGNVLFSDNDGNSWQNIDEGIHGDKLCGTDSLGFVYIIGDSGKLYKSRFTWFSMFNKNIQDFGNVVIHDSCYSTIHFINPLSVDLQLDSIKCSGEAFFINIVQSYFVPARDSISIDLSFIPDNFASYSGSLEIYSPIINYCRIRLIGNSPYPVLTQFRTRIIFPWTFIDSTSTDTVRFFNNSTTNDLIVDSVYLTSGEQIQFDPINLPLIISPSDTSEIFLTFKPDAFGLVHDTLVILSNTQTGINFWSITGFGINPTGLNQDENMYPENTLLQNYPNPFNPISSIKFTLKNAQFVTLNVFDILGNLVATLVNEEKPAGNYTVEFDGSKLASGIYYYQITAGSFTQTRKMVLLK